MRRQDQEGEVGSCGAFPSVMSSRITGVLSPLLGSSISSERCITITTLDRKARLPVLPQSHQMRKWCDVKKSYSFAEELSADQLTVKARAKTVLLIQIADIDLNTMFIKHDSKITKSNLTSFSTVSLMQNTNSEYCLNIDSKVSCDKILLMVYCVHNKNESILLEEQKYDNNC